MKALKDMSNGSKSVINVGFLFTDFDNWTGGINYFKNLFIACSLLSNPQIIPCIPAFAKENFKNYAQIIKCEEIKPLRYYIKKFVYFFKKKKFNPEKYIIRTYDNIDVISHTQIIIGYPVISWIPDFQHLHLPDFFSQRENLWRNKDFMHKAEMSKIIILSSYDALEDLKQFAPKYAHKGRVLQFVAIPDKDVYKNTDKHKNEIIKKLNLPDKYFYLPNQFWQHKNHKIVFEAVSILKEQGIDITVLTSGNTEDYRKPQFFKGLMNFIKEKNIEQNIKILGLIDMIDVYYLMRNCVSIINPSLFEGWSSTVEEAKSLGKNIILSDLNVHREQNPPHAIYFDPHNAPKLAQILKDKWQNTNGGPDYEYEEKAKSELEGRIINFAKTYRDIVKEALQI